MLSRKILKISETNSGAIWSKCQFKNGYTVITVDLCGMKKYLR